MLLCSSFYFFLNCQSFAWIDKKNSVGFSWLLVVYVHVCEIRRPVVVVVRKPTVPTPIEQNREI